MSKRYVLFYSNTDLSEDDLVRFSEVVRGWYQSAKVISVKGNPRAVIVRTTNQVAPVLRDTRPRIRVAGIEFVSVLTSGAIGKLKKRASGIAGDGKVP